MHDSLQINQLTPDLVSEGMGKSRFSGRTMPFRYLLFFILFIFAKVFLMYRTYCDRSVSVCHNECELSDSEPGSPVLGIRFFEALYEASFYCFNH